MRSAYNIRDLVPQKITQAFTVIHWVYPEMSRDTWAQCARERTCREGLDPTEQGILTVENAQECIQGLFCYHVSSVSPRGRTLLCEDFIVLDLLGLDEPLMALLSGAESYAQRFECRLLSLSLPRVSAAPPSGGSRLYDTIAASGYATDGLHLVKNLN